VRRQKGHLPSHIGALLYDTNSDPLVHGVTGGKILRMLKARGLAPEVPEDLYFLIKKAVAIRKHLGRNRTDVDVDTDARSRARRGSPPARSLARCRRWRRQRMREARRGRTPARSAGSLLNNNVALQNSKVIIPRIQLTL